MTDSTTLSIAAILEQRGLYRMTSSSATVYYVDTRDADRPPLYLRARGRGNTFGSAMDDVWRTITLITAGPVEWEAGRYLRPDEIDHQDVLPWVLRSGSRHVINTPRGIGNYWVQGRVCQRLELLTEMPPMDDLTVPEADPDPDRWRPR